MAATYSWIAGSTLTGNASGISVGSIPATYTDLIAVLMAKDVRAIGAVTDVLLYVNGDTGGSSYNWQVGNVNTSSPTSAFQGSNSSAMLPLGGNGTSQPFFTIRFEFPSYTSSFSKTVLAYGGPTESSFTNPRFAVGYYRSSSAINSILVNGEQGFITGTTLNIYGILKA
jgi:hypothetical protein